MGRVFGPNGVEREDRVMGTFRVKAVDLVRAWKWLERQGITIEGRNSIIANCVGVIAELEEREHPEISLESWQALDILDRELPVKNFKGNGRVRAASALMERGAEVRKLQGAKKVRDRMNDETYREDWERSLERREKGMELPQYAEWKRLCENAVKAGREVPEPESCMGEAWTRYVEERDRQRAINLEFKQERERGYKREMTEEEKQERLEQARAMGIIADEGKEFVRGTGEEFGARGDKETSAQKEWMEKTFGKAQVEREKSEEEDNSEQNLD